MVVCGITGHRKCENMYNRVIGLNIELYKIAKKNKLCVVVGMAAGVDTLVADWVLYMRDNLGFDVSLYCILPYRSFANTRSAILEKANKIEYECEKYEKWCYAARDRKIVDKSDIILSVYDEGRKSGTRYTVSYARNKKKSVLIF